MRTPISLRVVSVFAVFAVWLSVSASLPLCVGVACDHGLVGTQVAFELFGSWDGTQLSFIFDVLSQASAAFIVAAVASVSFFVFGNLALMLRDAVSLFESDPLRRAFADGRIKIQ